MKLVTDICSLACFATLIQSEIGLFPTKVNNGYSWSIDFMKEHTEPCECDIGNYSTVVITTAGGQQCTIIKWTWQWYRKLLCGCHRYEFYNIWYHRININLPNIIVLSIIVLSIDFKRRVQRKSWTPRSTICHEHWRFVNGVHPLVKFAILIQSGTGFSAQCSKS